MALRTDWETDRHRACLYRACSLGGRQRDAECPAIQDEEHWGRSLLSYRKQHLHGDLRVRVSLSGKAGQKGSFLAKGEEMHRLEVQKTDFFYSSGSHAKVLI